MVAQESEFDGMTREELLDRAMTRGFPHLVGKGKFVSKADAGEPTDEDLAVMVGRSVRLPADLDARVRRIADQLDTSVSDLIRQWISQGVASAESRGSSDSVPALDSGDEGSAWQSRGEPEASDAAVNVAWRRDLASATFTEAQIKSMRWIADSMQRQFSEAQIKSMRWAVDSMQRQVDRMMHDVSQSVHRQVEQLVRESMAVPAMQASILRGLSPLQRQAQVLREPETTADRIVSLYRSGWSIRAVAAQTGRSYGFVHRVLTASGVQIRHRGGAIRKRKVT